MYWDRVPTLPIYVLGQGSNIANRCCNWGRFIAIPQSELKLERFQVQLLGVGYSEVEAQGAHATDQPGQLLKEEFAVN